MLPLPTNTESVRTQDIVSPTDRVPVKHDLYNLDSLISDLNTPKEVIQASRPTAGAGINSFPGSTANEFIDSPSVEPIPAEIAALSGKAIAGTIDTVLSTGLSLYAQAPSAEKYEASQKQIEKLNQAWGAVAQKYNYKVEDSPWFNVILLMVAVYFPIWRTAQDDHWKAVMKAEIKSELSVELKAEIKSEMKEEIKQPV